MLIACYNTMNVKTSDVQFPLLLNLISPIEIQLILKTILLIYQAKKLHPKFESN